MLSHGEDLRAEVRDDTLVDAVSDDYQRANLDSRDRAMLDFAVKATRHPAAMSHDDVDGLRAQGFSDLEIHDIVQVTAYFNYINRIADALGVDLEPEMPPRGS